MAEARNKADWTRMSHLLALTHNTHVGKDELLTPNDFNPFSKDDELEYLSPEETNGILKASLGIKE